MQILLWLVPPVVVTLVAMAWVSWAGRARPVGDDRSESARERERLRFAAAIMREHPGATPRRTTPRDRSTGVAVRGVRPRPGDSTRRSA